MKDTKKKTTSKQIVALIGVILLVLMYIITLIAAITDHSASGKLFFTSLLATMFIPMLVWIYTWLFGKFTGKHTFTDTEFPESESDTEN